VGNITEYHLAFKTNLLQRFKGKKAIARADVQSSVASFNPGPLQDPVADGTQLLQSPVPICRIISEAFLEDPVRPSILGHFGFSLYHRRLHSSLGYRPPTEWEEQHQRASVAHSHRAGSCAA